MEGSLRDRGRWFDRMKKSYAYKKQVCQRVAKALELNHGWLWVEHRGDWPEVNAIQGIDALQAGDSPVQDNTVIAGMVTRFGRLPPAGYRSFRLDRSKGAIRCVGTFPGLHQPGGQE